MLVVIGTDCMIVIHVPIPWQLIFPSLTVIQLVFPSFNLKQTLSLYCLHGKEALLFSIYSIQHYVIKFVSDLWQVSGFLRVLRFPPPIKLTAWGINIYIINIWQIENNKASLPCKQYRLRVCFKLKDGKTNCITVRLGKINCQAQHFLWWSAN
jgi:hypothetical protein